MAPRTLSVVTGHPGHGKTALWAQIWFQVVKQYGIPACIASFETRPKPHYRRILRTLLTGKLEKDLEFGEHRKADQWIDERYLFVVHPEQSPSLEWILDKVEVAVVRHGARIVQADPWNRMEVSRARDETETEYIGRCLRNLHAFAHDMNVHLQILAHPAKMGGDRKTIHRCSRIFLARRIGTTWSTKVLSCIAQRCSTKQDVRRKRISITGKHGSMSLVTGRHKARSRAATLEFGI